MGAKTKIEQAPTLTPEQKVLLDYMMRGATNQMQGFILGEGWGGPSFESYEPGSGYGGKAWDTSKPASGSGAGRGGRTGGRRGGGPESATGAAIASMPIPSAPGTAPVKPGFVNPYASYSDRDKLVNPVVNPFRRNLGG